MRAFLGIKHSYGTPIHIQKTASTNVPKFGDYTIQTQMDMF